MNGLGISNQNIGGEALKIDSLATDGLMGVEDSLAYRVNEIERHFHGPRRWWGAVAVPDEANAIDSNADTPFQATSGNNTWGAAIPILGTADDPTDGLGVRFDPQTILITDLDGETDTWKLRFVWGTGTSADAIAAGQFSEVMVTANSAIGIIGGGFPIMVGMPRLDVGIKLWAQAWNDTLGEIASFFWGCHTYPG